MGMGVSDETNTTSASAAQYFGVHAGLIWDKLSVNLGFKGLFGDIEADVAYNFINTDYFVWSAGGRFALDAFAFPGFGLSTNLDGLIPISPKVFFDIGLGVAFCNYPTMGSYISSTLGTDGSSYTVITFELTPRIGVSIKQ